MEEAAARVRNLLGVSLDTQVRWRNTNTALREWRKAMERKGICVFREPLETDEISGFCLFDSQFPVIYLNSSMPKSRQIFTIFHELAHNRRLAVLTRLTLSGDSNALNEESRSWQLFGWSGSCT